MPSLRELRVGEQRKPDSAFGKIIDYLSRGQYASVGVARALMEERPEDIPDEIWAGLTGKTRGSYVDVAKENDSEHPIISGIAGDILLDPVTYIPIGGLVGKGAKGVYKMLPKAGQEALSVAGKVMREAPITQALGKAFVPDFRPKGISPEIWGKFTNIRKGIKALKNSKIEDEFKFANEMSGELKKLLKKGTITEDSLTDVISSVERRGFKQGLPNEVRPIYDKLMTKFQEIEKRRGALGRPSITDSDYQYVIRSLSDKEIKALKKSGHLDMLKEFTLKTPSDLARDYYKFVDIDDPTVGFFGKAGDPKNAVMFSPKGGLKARQEFPAKLVPLTMKGISQEHLGEMFESTIKDLSDLQDVAKTYGITIKFTPKHTTLGGKAVGYWQPKGRIFRIATGRRDQAEWMSTAAHELAHVVHGELGSMGALFNPPAKEMGKYAKAVLPKGDWAKVEEKIAELSIEAKDLILKSRGYTEEYIKANKKYLNAPTELFARFIQTMKEDPQTASSISSALYQQTMEVFKNDSISRKARNIFLSPLDTGKRHAFDTIFKDVKTGKIYTRLQADASQLSKAYPGKFSNDIPRLSFLAGTRMAKTEAGEQLYKAVQELGSPVELPGYVKGGKELGGLHYPATLIDEIEKTKKAFTNEESLKGFIKVFDNVQNFWKSWTLGVYPSTFVRNMIGNTWNNYLAGVVNPKHYADAFKIMVSGGKGLSKAEIALAKEAKEAGVLGKTFFNAEGLSTLESAPSIQNMGKAAYDASMAIPRKGLEWYSKSEDLSRLAHYIAKRKAGLSVSEAANSVKKYLFDYFEVTPFEKEVMKRVFPFYTWTRKNIPLQLEALVKQPGKLMPIEKIRKASETNAGNPDKELLPPWVRERSPLFLGKKGSKVSYTPLEGFIPFADLQKLSRPQEIPQEMLSPFIKAPIELGTNYNMYFEQPIKSYPGETKRFLGKDIPAEMEYILRQMRPLAVADRFVGKGKLPEGAPPQPSKGEVLAREFTGVKIGKVDLEKSKKYVTWKLRKELEMLRLGLSKAKTFGRAKEMKRIEAEIEDIKKKMEKYK